MKIVTLVVCLLALAGPLAAQDTPQAPAPAASTPTRVMPGAKIYIDPADEFGMAFAAAVLKKKVAVVTVNDREKADFFFQATTTASKEGTGERVAKILVFGGFAGSGRRFEGTATITNRDGAIIFAHNSKKENFQSTAENIAKNLKKHIEEK